MKAEAGAPWSSRSSPLRRGYWNKLLDPVRRVPQRLRQRQFWQVQALVAIATAPHYAMESLGYTNPFETLHGLAITLYILPLLYAALSYGWEGAVLTALWGATLTSPSMWIWHRSEYHWFTELGQMAVTLPVGVLVAWRVDLEAKQRRRAEQTSASLSLLNEIGESLSHTLDVEERLPAVLRRLLSSLPLRAAWLCLEPESAGGDLLVITEVADSRTAAPTGLARDLHEQLAATLEPVTEGDRTVAVPLLTEAGVQGSLGVTQAEPEPLSDETLELLMTAAHQVSVAVENARLYRQRQESMQSYVRRITEAQEEERLRIARDLHDDTAQELVGLVRRLEQLRSAGDATISRPVDELLEKARATLHSVRRYSRDLRPSVLDDLGLLAALEMVVEGVDGRLAGGARLQVGGEPRRLPAPVELALFRIAQEALRNVEKHAEATSVTVELDFREEAVRLGVSDDGRGFAVPRNVSDLARMGKLGLLGMKERAELVGGSFELSSSRGRGTNLAVTVAMGDG